MSNEAKFNAFDYQYQIDKICGEIIVLVMDASRSHSGGGADKLHGSLCAKFDAAIRLCEVERFPVDSVLELLYPLAALADETFMALLESGRLYAGCRRSFCLPKANYPSLSRRFSVIAGAQIPVDIYDISS